jgi:hypothetical protein
MVSGILLRKSGEQEDQASAEQRHQEESDAETEEANRSAGVLGCWSNGGVE